jgi:dephospho-CoA kinase
VALHVFGLTGGIGSGKSTVAARLRARGLPVLDADQLAREVVLPGTPGLAAIVERFGPGVLNDEGTLDRKKLASIVFGDEPARLDLNAITHPRVGERFRELTAALDARGEPLACYEVPLLFEGHLADVLRPVVVVAAPVDVQLKRAALRDGASPDEVAARIRAQLPLDEKVRRADHVIDNSGPLLATLEQTDRVLDAICAALDVDPARYPRV